MKYTVVVKVKLAYEFDTKTAQEAYIESQHVELPANYVEWSWDTAKVFDDDWNEYVFDPQDNEK